MIDDQYTFELVRDIVRRNIRLPEDLEFFGVESLNLSGGNFRVNTDQIETLPNKYEEKIRTFINNTPTPRQYKQTTHLETIRSIVFEVEKNVTTSTEYKFSFSISNAIAKLNADMVQKSSFSITTKETQKVEEKQIIDYPEDYIVQPNTILTVKYVSIKGIAKAPVSGSAIIDGLVNIKARKSTGVSLPPYYIVSGLFRLTDNEMFIIEPKTRQTQINGFLMAESYESIEVSYTEKLLSDSAINFELLPNVIKTNHGLLVLDGDY